MVRFQLAFSFGEGRDGPKVCSRRSRQLPRRTQKSNGYRTAVLSSIAGPFHRLARCFRKTRWLENARSRPSFGSTNSRSKSGAGVEQMMQSMPGQAERSGSWFRRPDTCSVLALGRGQMRSGGSFQARLIEPSLPVARTLLNEAAKLAASEIPHRMPAGGDQVVGLGDVKTGDECFPDYLMLESRPPSNSRSCKRSPGIWSDLSPSRLSSDGRQ